jgi:spermidine synthase
MSMPVPRALIVLFSVSGATSLVYQTVWARELHHMLGTSSTAISTVLAAFMAGLGLGGALAARYAPQVARPLRVYGALEVGIGLWALAFPWMVAGLTPLYRVLGSAPLHALLAALVLLPPTVAMGATLPLLARLVADRRGTMADRVAVLYASNTLGAVAGTALAGLVLLPTVGLLVTTLIAAGSNLLLGVVAAILDPSFPPLEPEHDLEVMEELEVGPLGPVPVLPVAFLAGAASLACEVAWTRLVGLILGGTTYAFTAMLLSVLLGIALGGRLAGPLADDALRWGGARGVLAAVALVEIALGVLGVALTFVWPLLPYLYVWTFDAFDGRHHPFALFVASLGCSILALLPPSVLMGAAFPLLVRAAAGDDPEVSAPVGRVYAANTMGAVAGALLAGFVVLPALGLRASLGVAAALNALAASVAAHRAGRPWTAAGLTALALPLLLLRAPWDPLWMSGGMYQYVSQFDNHSVEGMWNFATKGQELMFHDEGRSTVVTVGRNLKSGNIWLANNGKVDASTSGDMPTQVLVALAGAQYVEKPEDVLVIGLASGITAGSVTLLPELGHLEVVELEPAVVRAAALFAPYNHDVLNNPRVEVIVNDGRNHLLRAAPGSYDLVVSEPSNPYLSGVANLFTQEFWELGKTRLKPGGIWAQWIQLYGMGPDELRGLLRTFAEVYPHVALYVAIEGADIVVVGADRDLSPDRALAERLLAHEPIRAELAAAKVRFPLDLVALHAMDRDQVLAFAGTAPFVTDDNLRVEYAAPLWLHTDVSLRNWEELLAAAHVPDSALSATQEPLDWLDLADTYERLGDLGRADRVRAHLFGWLPPGDPLQEQVLSLLTERETDP